MNFPVADRLAERPPDGSFTAQSWVLIRFISSGGRLLNFGFVMEQTLGHVTHAQNLARWVAEDASVCPRWMPIEFQKDDFWEKLPVVGGNWSLKASLRARDELKKAMREIQLDALFLHTQTTALFSVPILRKIPSIVSLDATPVNYDSVGAEYGHESGNNGALERRKQAWNRATFHAATALVTWCQWAKDSLVADYGIEADKVTVIPPGVDMEKWAFGSEKANATPADSGPTRLLFVGADFKRKGGEYLTAAFRENLNRNCELDIVTRDMDAARELANIEGLRVHTGLTANHPNLRELYARADLFVFPTLGDCLPIAVMEAMAAGLPVIATRVGALREEVEHGVNGLVIPPRDAQAIAEAARMLTQDAAKRRAMSAASREMAEQRFDAKRNYNAILALMKQCAAGTRNAGGTAGAK